MCPVERRGATRVPAEYSIGGTGTFSIKWYDLGHALERVASINSINPAGRRLT